MDPAIAAKKRHSSFTRAAVALGIDLTIPSTKSDIVARESYIAALLKVLAEQGATLSARLDDLERRLDALDVPKAKTAK